MPVIRSIAGQSHGHEEATSASCPEYGQEAHESSTSDADDESKTASEAEPGQTPELSWSSPSLKRKRSNANHASWRHAAPFPAPSSPDRLSEVESEPMLPSLDRLTYSEPTLRDFRRNHRRKACEAKKPPSPSSSYLALEIGSPTPSISVPESEFQPPESEPESRYLSPSPTSMIPASSPPVPQIVSQVRSGVLSALPLPRRWLSRFERPDQKSSLSETAWTSRLRRKWNIKPVKVPLMLDGKKYPCLFDEFPPAAHENPDFMFPDNSDDDPDFEFPKAKRRRLGLSGDAPEIEESAEREESSEPEQSSDPEPYWILSDCSTLRHR
ncbi:unnamed protein product [Penicillium egyptiacum]|uniref:Uncharacterized protein n=1 Tax=Penicillium egyptiacum TaxID=1303716 RepID=A0A9W4P109_9EURO|nr:unnamed protein product [Penicillium egyptiacum]